MMPRGCSRPSIPRSAAEVFYHQADRALAQAAARRLTPQPEGRQAVAAESSPQRFGTVPRVYIEARQDRSVHLPLQRKMQELTPVSPSIISTATTRRSSRRLMP